MKLAGYLSNRLRGEELTAAIKRELERIDYVAKGDTMTHQWTDHSSILEATYVDAENKFWYAVSLNEYSNKHEIRKMSITRDVAYARAINIKAKGLLGKKVIFGVTKGWNPNVWFNDIQEILS
jgi:hypothetical protein